MIVDKEKLPSSWKTIPLENVVNLNPKIDKSIFDNELPVSFVPMPAVEAETGNINISEIKTFGSVKKGYTAFQEHDVLFAKITPCMENGKMAVVPQLKNGLGFGSTEFHVLRSYSGVSPQYIYYYVSSKTFRVDSAHNMTGAVGQRRVPAPWLASVNISLPPIEEQHRIVAKIEELFSELDKGIESLKTAREQLKVYRQALLKHAFEGKLTEQWRKENADKQESADDLLARIQQERETRYQQQLEGWKIAVKQWDDKGKEGKKPSKPRELKLPELITHEEKSNLSSLPDNWTWVKVGSLTWSVKDGPHYSPKYAEMGVLFISGGNVRPEGVDFNNVKYISQELHEELCKRCKPEVGDVLYTKGGTTGIARVNTYDINFNVWVHIAVLKIVDSIEPFFLQHVLNSPFPYSQSQKFTHGVGNQDLGLTRMVNIITPICGSEEQIQVIAEIERITSVLDEQNIEIENSLIKSEALRQSILKKAFSGQLVSQDPDDEPAAVLLERIKAEKAEQDKQAKARKTTKKKLKA